MPADRQLTGLLRAASRLRLPVSYLTSVLDDPEGVLRAEMERLKLPVYDSSVIVVTPGALDPEHRIFEGVPDGAGPHWSTGEVAKLYGLSVHWVYWVEKRLGARAPKGQNKARQFHLPYLEEFTHLLLEGGRITPDRAVLILTVLENLGRIHGLIGDDAREEDGQVEGPTQG